MLADSTMLSVTGLSKCYHLYEKPHHRLWQFLAPGRRQFHHDFWALKDVSFEAARGETLGIIGRNGSGKSTLLQMICGTLNPSSGNIRTGGRIAALLELGSGFNPEFTGRENLRLNGALLGLTSSELDARQEAIAEFADIGEFLDRPIKTYSSGMVVRLAFAVAVNADPQILVVDEALSVGDEMFQRKCIARIEAIKRGGTTILFVSHAGATIIELCDRVLLLDGGELIATGEPKRMVGEYQRLLYASAEMRVSIRSLILSGSDGQPPVTTPLAVAGAGSLRSPVVRPDIHEYLDPGLKSQSIIAYESRGATIEYPTVVGSDDRPVNCLRRGRQYHYRYVVRFDRGATNVRFAMLIKSISGIELGGAVSAPDLGESISYVPAGSVYQVDFRFEAKLNPGVYYMNAGVTGNIGAEDGYLHRLLDAFAFRILPEGPLLATAIVDFSCEPNVKILK